MADWGWGGGFGGVGLIPKVEVLDLHLGLFGFAFQNMQYQNGVKAFGKL